MIWHVGRLRLFKDALGSKCFKGFSMLQGSEHHPTKDISTGTCLLTSIKAATKRNMGLMKTSESDLGTHGPKKKKIKIKHN